MDDIAALEKTYAWAGQLLANVRPGQLDDPTPCTEWNVRTLIEHLIGSTGAFIAVLNGGDPSQAPKADPDDLAGSFARVAKENLEAWRAPGALDRTVAFSIGDIPATTAARFNIQEVFAHAWDLARATGQSTAVLDDVAEPALAFAEEMIKPEYRGPGMPIGERVPAPDDAPAADRLAGFLGRAV